MQYFVSVIDDATNTGTADEMKAIHAFNRRIKAEGHFVFAAGLSAPADATLVDGRGEKPLVVDGPFVETKEYLSGFWIMEAADLDEMRALAAEASKACNRRLEIRALL